MANLTPNPGWDDVTRLETTTRALGGPGGPMNSQAQALLNRSEYLKGQFDDLANAANSALGAALVGFGGMTLAQNLRLQWAYAQNFQLVSGTRDSNGALTSATITWPDGVDGVFTADTLSSAFPGAIDAWHATWLGATTETYTQPAVTRDANGAVIVQPAITIS